MSDLDFVLMWISLVIPLITTLFCLIFGLRYFFKKKKPLFVQSLTMAMGSHALGSIYQLCITVSNEEVLEGFTPAYLGRIGFFLFILAASYGQLDKIVDDGSARMRPARLIALAAPALALLLFIPNAALTDVSIATKITYVLVWIPAMASLYFNMKHALIPDVDFNFIRVIRPYNVFALCLSFSELLCLTTWNYLHGVLKVLTAIIFSVFCILTIFAAKKGVEKWII